MNEINYMNSDWKGRKKKKKTEIGGNCFVFSFLKGFFPIGKFGNLTNIAVIKILGLLHTSY